MATAARLAKNLGGRRVLGERPATYEVLRKSVQAGLPIVALDELGRRFAIPQRDLLAAVSLPLRTFARRKKQGRLQPDESDRLLRVVRVATLAEDVLGDVGKASRWLQKPNRALGGVVPLHRLDTDLGAREVEDILGRIEYGVFS